MHESEYLVSNPMWALSDMHKHTAYMTSPFPLQQVDTHLYPSTGEQQGNTVSCATYSHHGCQESVDWEFWLTPEALEERPPASVNAASQTDKGS